MLNNKHITINAGLQFIQNDNPNDIIQGIFELKHLVLFSKCSNLSGTIQIHIKTRLSIST